MAKIRRKIKKVYPWGEVNIEIVRRVQRPGRPSGKKRKKKVAVMA